MTDRKIMDIQKIKNETLTKLTAEEIGNFGLLNVGFMTYRGQLKARRQGFKTEKVSDTQTNFVHNVYHYRVEFIRIQQTVDETEWVMRWFDTELNRYHDWVNPLAGVDFFK